MTEKRQDLPENEGGHLVKTFGDDDENEDVPEENGPSEDTTKAEEKPLTIRKEPTQKRYVPEMQPLEPMQRVKRFAAVTFVTLMNFLATNKVFPLGRDEYLSETAFVGSLFQAPWAENITVSSLYSFGLAASITWICHRWWSYFSRHDLTINLDWVLDSPQERFQFTFLSIMYALSIVAEVAALAARLKLEATIGGSPFENIAQMGFWATAAISLGIIFINAAVAYFNTKNMDD